MLFTYSLNLDQRKAFKQQLKFCHLSFQPGMFAHLQVLCDRTHLICYQATSFATEFAVVRHLPAIPSGQKHTLSSGPLHMLFPLSEMSCQMFTELTLSSHPGLCLNGTSLETSFLTIVPKTESLPTFSALFPIFYSSS